MGFKARNLFVYPRPRVVAIEPADYGRQIVRLEVPGMVCGL